MAVPENAGVKINSSSQVSATAAPNSPDKQNPRTDQDAKPAEGLTSDIPDSLSDDQETKAGSPVGGGGQVGQLSDGVNRNVVEDQDNPVKGLKSDDVGEIAEMMSKLNPMAEEFVPPSLAHNFVCIGKNSGFGFMNNFADAGFTPRRKRSNSFNSGGKKRMNGRTSMAQREEVIRRTIYVSDIDQQVTEERLAALFNSLGQVIDCRVCGDPTSCLRFAFIEFTDEEAARGALNLTGTILGFYPLKVMPSKTAIAPVNPTFLPQSEDEKEMCSRTVYCTNIDKKVTHAEVKRFFESMCGEVHRLRLLGDYNHSTRIAFVEFAMAESAIAALSCSGAVMGSLPIRVSPSKTPVRSRGPPPPVSLPRPLSC